MEGVFLRAGSERNWGGRWVGEEQSGKRNGLDGRSQVSNRGMRPGER
jgi:hypothetical protein